MLLFRIVLAALVLAGLVHGRVVSPKLSGSNGDQYREAGEAAGAHHPQVEMALFPDKDATDRSLLSAPNNNGRNPPNQQENGDPESKSKENIDLNRNKRSYHPYTAYTIQLPQYPSISVWRPSLYPFQRPYYVPIYGVDGRIPIYFPPQHVYLNPGTPPKNPGNPPYVGPTYLPPVVTPPTTSNGTTMMPTDNRFGGNDEDDRPIWDIGNEVDVPGRATTRRPSMIPTRKPAERTTSPPLVHKDEGSRPNNVNHLSSNTESSRIPITTTQPPARESSGPSRCVWAIVSCCSTSSKEVSYNCFDQLGCSGPFWDVSPCETEYAKAAIQTALNYYNSRP